MHNHGCVCSTTMVVNQASDGSSRGATAAERPVDLEALDLAQLAWLVGSAANEHVLLHLKAEGFAGLRISHGFVVQHLLREPQRIGQLAEALEISQQAVSKTIAELRGLGYVEDAPSADGRARVVRLSKRGHALVGATRAYRKRFDKELRALAGPRVLAHARRALMLALGALGAEPAIRGRRVPYPR